MTTGIKHKKLVSMVHPAKPEIAVTHFRDKLSYETDPADVYADMKNGVNDFVLVDVRRPDSYRQCHAPGAINIPVSRITQERLSKFPEETLFVTYCWGPGCNGSTKAALKISELGYNVKEMIGGIHYWEKHEGFPVEREDPSESWIRRHSFSG